MLVASLRAATVTAQPAEDESLYRRGADLREAGRDEEALAVFREVLERRPSGRARAQVALAEQALGRWLDADAHLRAALEDRADPWVRRHRGVLEGALAMIARHVGAIALSGEPAGARVSVDGAPVGMLPMSEPVRALAGEVTLEVSAPGRYPLTRRVTVRPGETVREAVSLRPLPQESEGQRAAVAERVVLRDVRVPVGAGPQRAIGWVSVGAAAIFAGVSIAAWVVREDAADRWNDDARCVGNGLTREQNCGDYRDTAESARVVAVSAAVGAGVLGVMAAVLLATSPRGRDARPAALRCAPGIGGVGCALRF